MTDFRSISERERIAKHAWAPQCSFPRISERTGSFSKFWGLRRNHCRVTSERLPSTRRIFSEHVLCLLCLRCLRLPSATGGQACPSGSLPTTSRCHWLLPTMTWRHLLRERAAPSGWPRAQSKTATAAGKTIAWCGLQQDRTVPPLPLPPALRFSMRQSLRVKSCCQTRPRPLMRLKL